VMLAMDLVRKAEEKTKDGIPKTEVSQ